jgi:hypothetical protein
MRSGAFILQILTMDVLVKEDRHTLRHEYPTGESPDHHLPR